MLIVRNNIETNIQLQPSRSLNKVKQDMLLVPKIVHVEHCYVSKGKMKVKKTTDKNMMNILVWVKRQSFVSTAMNSFCYENHKQISNGGVTMNTLKFNRKIHNDDALLKKVSNVMDGAWGMDGDRMGNMEDGRMGLKHSS